MSKRFDFTIRTKQDLMDAVESFGFVPLFRNSIPGFSVEEHVAPEAWFSEEDGVWEWKGPVIRELGCAYGKLFERKAAFVSRAWFPELANYRRDGYDFDARFDDGLASYPDRTLFDLVNENAPLLSRELKRIGNYRKGGRKGFDTCMNRLQEQCYVLISDFVYQTDKYGRQYGWGVAQYSTPEKFMGEDFTASVYRRSPRQSYGRILDHLHGLLPKADAEAIQKLLK